MTRRAAQGDEESPAALELVPPGRLRDSLVDAVLRGVKTATTRLDPPETDSARMSVGTNLRLIDSQGVSRAIVEVTRIQRARLVDVGDEVAHAEGDWFPDAAQWRAAHEAYWERLVPSVRRALGDPTWEINDQTIVVTTFFRVLTPEIS